MRRVSTLMPRSLRFACTSWSKHCVCLCISWISLTKRSLKGTHHIENRMKTYIHASSLPPTRSYGEIRLLFCLPLVSFINVPVKTRNLKLSNRHGNKYSSLWSRQDRIFFASASLKLLSASRTHVEAGNLFCFKSYLNNFRAKVVGDATSASS